MTVPIHYVVFDIGGVLLAYDVELPYRRLIPDAAQRRWFLENICTAEWNIEQDRGRSWADAEDLLIAQYPQYETWIRAFRENWHETITHAHTDTVETLLAMIASGVDVTLLSNWSHDTFEEIRTHHDFLNQPRAATISGSVGLIKPDAEIFHHHSRTHGCEPAYSLFIDDNAANIDTATRLGWQTIHYVDHTSFEKALSRYTISQNGEA